MKFKTGRAAVKTECPYCHKVYKVYDLFRGVRAECPECGRNFTVEPLPQPQEKKPVIQYGKLPLRAEHSQYREKP